jgi:hypothetical protein
MSEPLPTPNQCPRCKEWFHTVHVCAGDIKLMPKDCTTATLCREHGCHGECLPPSAKGE